MLGHGAISEAPIGALPDEIPAKPPMLDGDAARQTIGEDEFGLSPIVQSIKAVVRNRVAADGYALGIEGRWGSGKTTLLNFVQEALNTDASPYQKVIRFDPWLIGDKRTLLRTFFLELSKTIETFRNNARVKRKVGDPELVKTLKRLAEQIERYGKYVDTAAQVTAAAASIDPTLYGTVIAGILKAISSVKNFFTNKPPTLEDLKQKITNDLRVLKKLVPGASITVLIDDTDRLDPEESVEILRLIKAVANFPLIVYLVCFDVAILSRQVRRVVRVGDGEDYLEKIFQQIVPLPPQEPFALRRFITHRLRLAFPESADVAPEELNIRERQDTVYDLWMGKLIETPRDAIRLCESVKFGWPYLQGTGDFLDYVWLQLIKLKHRELYIWTRNYVTGLGSYRDGGRPGDEGHEEANKLSAILSKLGWGGANYRSRISLLLPGVKHIHLDGDKKQVFSFDPNSELDQFEAARRLGSPSHWRYYFAFDKPSYALSDAELSEFCRLAATDRPAAEGVLRNLAKKPHPTANYYLSVLLQRLSDTKKQITPEMQIGMAWTFAFIMDELPRGGEVQFSQDDPWRQALKLLGRPVASRITAITAEAPSINWLALVLRDQRHVLDKGDNAKSFIDRNWLNQETWHEAAARLIYRFRMLGINGILELPEPIQAFLCWHDFDAGEIRQIISVAVSGDDLMLVRILLGLRGWVNSSATGLGRIIHPETVELFMSAKDAKGRLEWIARASDTPPHIRPLASGLLNVWEGVHGRPQIQINDQIAGS